MAYTSKLFKVQGPAPATALFYVKVSEAKLKDKELNGADAKGPTEITVGMDREGVVKALTAAAAGTL
jgi:hypothetical protein